MKKITTLLAFASLILCTVEASARGKDHLQECWNKQAQLDTGNYWAITYTEMLREFYHSPEPWQELTYTGKGTVWYNADEFTKQDTLVSGRRTLFSKTHLNNNELLYIDYGHKIMSPVTPALVSEQLLNTCRYSPSVLIGYFSAHNITEDKESNKKTAVYKTLVNKTIVRLYIQKHDDLLSKITMLSDDELRGDVLSEFIYTDYKSVGNSFYPKRIEIEKTNGRIKDTVSILSINKSNTVPKLIDRPVDYTMKEDVKQEITTTVEKYSDNIYFINVQPAGARVMVVEFNDFLLVAEAPVNSKTGERIISEAKQIAPGKPIKYFAFGHHHPDYLGGMRAFIHKGATVLTVKDDEDYINYLATAPHTLDPDSLQLQPKDIKIQEVTDSTAITDGKYTMKMYVIGKKSHHTKDYLVYYFPAEQLLFEDDLVWIKKEGEVTKAGESQAGLYNAVKELGLHVTTIVQSWGISHDDYKTIIPYKDIEQSMTVK